LLFLHGHKEWQARFSGLLGIKYVVAVRTDLAHELLPRIYGLMTAGLADRSDDVKGASASVLLSAAPCLASGTIVPAVDVERMCNALWGLLQQSEELTASTAPVMDLLAELYGTTDSAMLARASESQLAAVIPLLLPFLHDSIASVRSSALRTLGRLIEARTWPPQIIQCVVLHLFYSITTDTPMAGRALGVW
jgi:TATA-binding protein-associated factor